MKSIAEALNASVNQDKSSNSNKRFLNSGYETECNFFSCPIDQYNKLLAKGIVY